MRRLPGYGLASSNSCDSGIMRSVTPPLGQRGEFFHRRAFIERPLRRRTDRNAKFSLHTVTANAQR